MSEHQESAAVAIGCREREDFALVGILVFLSGKPTLWALEFLFLALAFLHISQFALISFKLRC